MTAAASGERDKFRAISAALKWIACSTMGSHGDSGLAMRPAHCLPLALAASARAAWKTCAREMSRPTPGSPTCSRAIHRVVPHPARTLTSILTSLFWKPPCAPANDARRARSAAGENKKGVVSQGRGGRQQRAVMRHTGKHTKKDAPPGTAAAGRCWLWLAAMARMAGSLHSARGGRCSEGSICLRYSRLMLYWGEGEIMSSCAAICAASRRQWRAPRTLLLAPTGVSLK